MHASSNKASDWWKSLARHTEFQRTILSSYKKAQKIPPLGHEKQWGMDSEIRYGKSYTVLVWNHRKASVNGPFLSCLLHKLSYGNEFDLQDNEHGSKTHAFPYEIKVMCFETEAKLSKSRRNMACSSNSNPPRPTHGNYHYVNIKLDKCLTVGIIELFKWPTVQWKKKIFSRLVSSKSRLRVSHGTDKCYFLVFS